MSKEMIRNVLIKDGNRTVNWDFPAYSSVLDVLQLWHFDWEPDSVTINGKPVPDETLGSALCGYMQDGKLVIQMERKKKDPQKKEATDT